MQIDLILNRLQKVKAAGSDKWQACCPAHEDNSPSLSIKQADYGNILIKCWSGCSAQDICAAIGIELKDLFNEPQKFRSEYKPRQIDIKKECDAVAQQYSKKISEFLNG